MKDDTRETYEICYKALTEKKSVLLEASAGTGKTFTITHTVRKLLLDKQILPERILILTFTEKATNEMKTKLLEVFCAVRQQNPNALCDDPGTVLRRIPVMTIDGFWTYLLKNHLFETGADPDFSLTSPEELRDFIIEVVLRRDWLCDNDIAQRLKRIFKLSREDNHQKELTPELIANLLKQWLTLTEQNEAEIFFSDKHPQITEDLKFLYENLRQKYRDWLVTNGLKTYSSILDEIHVLATNKHTTLSNLIKKEYDFIFVDEFQDTNRKQWDIFHNLFEASNIPICLVGDPKQAIYAFRHADLENYLTIRQSIHDKDNWLLMQLDTNWRSSVKMVEALNRLFIGQDYLSENEDFFLMDGRLDFSPVRSSNTVQAPHNLQTYIEKQKPIHIIKASSEKKKDTRDQHNKFITQEILRLRNEGICSLSDICILVETKSIYLDLHPFLKQANIPYFYYKEEGILESEAAENFRQLLQALANQESQRSFSIALLTAFFGKALSDLGNNYPGSNEERFYLALVAAAEKRHWPQFFHLLRSSAVWSCAQSRSNREPERMLTDYRQLFEMLEEYAIREQCDINELAEYLFQARRQAASEYDLNLHPSASNSKDKVQIMTMHQSKGLEFPVVFALLNQSSGSSNISYPQLLDIYADKQKQPQKILFLQPKIEITIGPRGGQIENNISKNYYNQQKDREQRRLAYVAFTRAKYLLYIPVTEDNKESSRLTAKLAAISGDGNDLFQVSHLNETPQTEEVSEFFSAEPPSALFPVTADLFSSEREKKQIELLTRSRRIISYSSLSKTGEGALLSVERDKDADEPLISDFELPEENVLPKGSETGLMLHEILEQCDFTQLHKNKLSLADMLAECRDDKSSLPIVGIVRNLQKKYLLRPAIPFIDKDPDQIIIEHALTIIWNTVNALIPGLEISLAELKPEDCLKEVPFLFKPEDQLAAADIQPEKDYITGVIDLVFRYGGMVYFADYKSNTIPENISLIDYDRSEYALQRHFYRRALDIWLRQKNLQYGGNFYFYLRYCRASASSGILREDHAAL